MSKFTLFSFKQILLCICAEEDMIKFILHWEQEFVKTGFLREQEFIKTGFLSSQRF